MRSSLSAHLTKIGPPYSSPPFSTSWFFDNLVLHICDPPPSAHSWLHRHRHRHLFVFAIQLPILGLVVDIYIRLSYSIHLCHSFIFYVIFSIFIVHCGLFWSACSPVVVSLWPVVVRCGLAVVHCGPVVVCCGN